MTIEYKKGMILVEPFGYSMTLYNFYKVVRVSGKAVDLIKLPHETVETVGFMEYVVKPKNKTAWLQREVIKKRINKIGLIRMHGNLYPYNENEKYIENHAD